MPSRPAAPAPRSEATPLQRRLSTFTGAGYDKGRSRIWQVAWFTVLNVVFVKWWFPPRLRPAVLRLFGATVGHGVLIRHGVRVHWPWKLVIGDACWIGEGARLLNLEDIVIGSDVCVSQEAFLCTGSHRHDDPAFGFDNAPITLGPGSWVAARAVVLRGADLRPGEVVAAGAVRRRSSGAPDTGAGPA